MERLSEEVSRLQSLVAQHEIEKGQQESNRTVIFFPPFFAF